MNTVNYLSSLNSRYPQKISDKLESEIKQGEFISQNWHYNQFPGAWIYKINDKFVEIQIADRFGFSFEAMFV
jgi:hypothetical protein